VSVYQPCVGDSDLIEPVMIGPHGGLDLHIASPLLVVIETKRTPTLQLTSSEAEVLGQMRALMTK